jgi:trimethylguanosine synthase
MKQQEISQEKTIPSHLQKFIKRKYYYFSRYDEGIKIDDEEGWYSVTAEPIAKYTSYFLKKVKNAIVVDCCCSVGGNLIQFALEENTEYALGIEMNKTRKEYAINNSLVYNVPRAKIGFVESDISKVDFIYEL